MFSKIKLINTCRVSELETILDASYFICACNYKIKKKNSALNSPRIKDTRIVKPQKSVLSGLQPNKKRLIETKSFL